MKSGRSLLRVVITLITLTLLAVAGGVATSAPASAAVADQTTTVDDATTGNPGFAYTGEWVDCGGCNSGASNNSFRYSATRGSTAVLTFTGTRAEIVGFREPQGGIAAISVDGGAPVDADFYQAKRSLGRIFQTALLPARKHTVRLTVTGRSSRGSQAINIDGAVITQGKTVPQGLVSFSFDDGQVGHFVNARPALEAAGMRGTFYIISDALGYGPPSMDAAQVRQLAAKGHEIGNHTRD